MLGKEDWMTIKTQVEQGVYLKDIAAELDVHPKTVRRALDRGGPPSGKRPKARKSKLDPYKGHINKRLEDKVRNAVVIFREIQEMGYTGEITILREYMKPRRPARVSRRTVRYETAPGVQLQNDWGEVRRPVGGQLTKICFNTNTLGFSRRFHFWCTPSMDAENTYEGVVRAFEHFGGVTQETLVDNQKSMVIEHRIGDRVRFNERFLDLGFHYGFTPRACKPRRARTKGKDERMVGYIKHHFFVRYQEFESFAHLNQLAEKWLEEEADRRFHGTVKEVVIERFTRELPYLSPLPPVRFDTSYRETRFAHWDGYIDVRGNRYSVPHDVAGSMVVVHIGLDGILKVCDADDRLVAEHLLRSARDGWVTVDAHHAPLWQDLFQVERRDLAVYEEVSRCN